MNYSIQRPFAELRETLSSYRQCSPRTKSGYKSVMKIVIKDLFSLRLFFNSFKETSMENINALIQHWIKHKLSKVTIGSRLSIIRKYCDLLNSSLTIPSNLELGLKREKSKNKNVLSNDYLNIINTVEHKLTSLMIQLQALLGLTKQEAIKFQLQSYHHAENKVLYVSKRVSHDNKDRLILIRSQAQEEVIHLLSTELDQKNSLQDKYNKVTLVNLYNAELAILNHSPTLPFRAVYARNLLDYFVNQQQLSQKDAVAQIAQEMGISDLSTIKNWLHDE